MIIFLNHTSLLEPIFLAVLPINFLWAFAKHGLYPAADITINRPIVGRMFKILSPNTVSITRLRDSSWQTFLSLISDKSMIVIMPEGRRKRKTGLDKYGKPMTVRGGVVDALKILGQGPMLLAVSGGLHDLYPLKKLKISFEVTDIKAFLEVGQFNKTTICENLERTRDLRQTF